MAQSEQEILEGLAEIVNEETGLDTDSVELDKSFTDDLDIDSLSMMTIVVNAEEKFGVRIPDDEVKNLKTVRDAVGFIASARADPRRTLTVSPGPAPGAGRHRQSAAGPAVRAPPARRRPDHCRPQPTDPRSTPDDQPEQRIVVTGLGATTPLGGTVPETWDAILAGRSGARTMPYDWVAAVRAAGDLRRDDQVADPRSRSPRSRSAASTPPPSTPSSPPARRGPTPARPRSSPSGSPSPSAPASAASGPC